MKVTRGLADYKQGPYPVLTIGNFDGHHLGHRALLQAVVETATAKGGTPMVLTFEPHPIAVVSPGAPLCLLMEMEDRLAGFQEAGIEEVLIVEFNTAFAALTPEEFVRGILKDGIGVKELFVGEQFAFGRGRAGKIADLRRLGEEVGIRVHAVPAVRINGELVSATKIRKLVQAGDVRRAAHLLGHPYAISGQVVQGEHRGRALGWPTANLRLPADRAIPADGVYATRLIWNKRVFASVSYIGTRPTFGPGERLLEVHALDEEVDLSNQQIRVEFIDRLRDDLTFRSAEELSARIQQDVLQARETLRAASGTS